MSILPDEVDEMNAEIQRYADTHRRAGVLAERARIGAEVAKRITAAKLEVRAARAEGSRVERYLAQGSLEALQELAGHLSGQVTWGSGIDNEDTIIRAERKRIARRIRDVMAEEEGDASVACMRIMDLADELERGEQEAG